MQLELEEREATYEDLMALPENMVGEILFGRLVTHPRPAPRHSVVTPGLMSELVGPYQRGRNGPGGWVFMDEPELHLGRHVVVPDIAGWKREHLPRLPQTAFIETPPDWICEILSPSTEVVDRREKRAIYAETGVPFLWHVDPRPRVLEAFTLKGPQWLLTHTFSGSEPVSAPPFEAITFDLAVLWPLDPAPADT
jgi:Uma2 family endonuclease